MASLSSAQTSRWASEPVRRDVTSFAIAIRAFIRRDDVPALTGPASRMLTATKRSPLGLGTIYAGATALPRLISLALLPVFTYVLSPAAYGQVSVALSAYTVATIVFSLGLDLAVFRNLFMLADDPDTLNRFVGSVWSYLLVVPGAGALALSAVAAPCYGTAKFYRRAFRPSDDRLGNLRERDDRPARSTTCPRAHPRLPASNDRAFCSDNRARRSIRRWRPS